MFLYKHHSDLLSSFSVLTLNGLILTSKISNRIPKTIPRISVAFLSYTGLISLNIQAREFKKTVHDFQSAFQGQETLDSIVCGLKTYVKGCDILLQLTCSIASLLALFGMSAVAGTIFAATPPFALLSLALSIATELYQWQKIDQLSHSPPTSFTPKIIRLLDLYTFEHLTGQSPQEVLGKIKQQQEANFAMIVLGWGAMGLIKGYPDTLISASVNFSMSLLFMIKLCWLKSGRQLSQS
jgi:hypothetical protein